ncbi:tRNA (adenosine(37)-N6)-threonylcarbamoyltransferase complex dimerization subunit type 1 TsaB [bacterium]|jgi:tRNA threonylcarbamoyladenosine biosynthesis protein TsaB|nr:tRNA (adenosine(37)-N6)-threonylcarbamoyltransferase complex dimerization subunit type 1 TsaB [bacterium]
MRFLTWDTSSKTGAIAAIETDVDGHQTRLVSEWSLNIEMSTHSEHLLWAIDQVLDASKWTLSDVDVFGVGVGPGSFTGLRIGVVTARTLAHTMQKPLVSVSSLSVLARPAAIWAQSQKEPTVIVATTDACKGELFALWGKAQDVAKSFSGTRKGVAEKVIRPADLISEIKSAQKKSRGTRWLAVGEGRQRYLEEWKKLSAKQARQAEYPFPDQVQGRYLAMLTLESYQALEKKKALSEDADPLKVFPHYVRASDAEMKLKAGLLK